MTKFTPKTEQEVADIIKSAYCEKTPLHILGTGSKQRAGRPVQAPHDLNLSALQGITHYAPHEMVLEAYAGTPLSVIEAELDKSSQEFAFEPCLYNLLYGNDNQGTIGGLAAMNISGARRVKVGAMRDAMIGVRGVNGKGELFKSGGKVMKNVTGYDLVKLVAGSYGTLAALTHISLKVQPKLESQLTMQVATSSLQQAVLGLCKAMGTPFDVSGAAVTKGGHSGWTAHIRLEGFAHSIAYRFDEMLHDLKAFGKVEKLENDASLAVWAALKAFAPIADAAGPIWRISVKPTDAHKVVDATHHITEKLFLDWSGGLIWLALDPVAAPQNHDELVRAALSGVGGHATLVRGSKKDHELRAVFQPLNGGLKMITSKIKSSFDPCNILNPGKMYPDTGI